MSICRLQYSTTSAHVITFRHPTQNSSSPCLFMLSSVILLRSPPAFDIFFQLIFAFPEDRFLLPTRFRYRVFAFSLLQRAEAQMKGTASKTAARQQTASLQRGHAMRPSSLFRLLLEFVLQHVWQIRLESAHVPPPRPRRRAPLPRNTDSAQSLPSATRSADMTISPGCQGDSLVTHAARHRRQRRPRILRCRHAPAHTESSERRSALEEGIGTFACRRPPCAHATGHAEITMVQKRHRRPQAATQRQKPEEQALVRQATEDKRQNRRRVAEQEKIDRCPA